MLPDIMMSKYGTMFVLNAQCHPFPYYKVHEDTNKFKLKKNHEKEINLHEKLTSLEDFRRGTISVNYRKCGKKNCACAKPGHPSHGPQYLWNTTNWVSG
ncbi:MAG: hypothetical protein PF690_15105 [Deltaproteobacteria bacterium]|jgi:hypothetical protein|nr:hypothetical protein [Deltaproteobacteria bacterium]